MAPKVCVPADFGRHHIGAPSHGNLTFNLGEGVQIKANSIILSLNSPVIDDLTTNLHLTSLEAEDFSREAVDCFIEASYTGEIEAVTVGNFRDVNKMSRVFQVDWLVARCEKYFVSYLDKLDSESSYPDILFAVEEAVYLLSTVKKRDFLELVIKKMCTFSVLERGIFVKEYLSDIVNSTKCMIDACIAISASDAHIFADLLISHFEQPEVNGLDEQSRHLLRNLNLSLCFTKDPETHTKLFAVLQSLDKLETEDFRMLLEMLQQLTSNKKYKSSPMENKSIQVWNQCSFDKGYFSLSINAVLDKLCARDDVDDLYKLFEGLWCAYDNKGKQFNSSVLKKISDIKEQRGWNKMQYKYPQQFLRFYFTKSYVEGVQKCNMLVCKENEGENSVIIEYSGLEFVQNIFLKDSKIKFQLKDPKY